MALHPFRLRRALSLSFSLLHRSLPGTKPIFPDLPSTSCPTRTPIPFSTQLSTRLFTSTTTVFRKTFDPETDEIGPDTILFEGCDYNHWLITMDFPKDSNITREQMIETYVNTAAQVLGSVEEAKKKIYALSTTTYQGFQVECTEETSEKFKSLPGVVFVLPDSYIDPVNKEYGGDKYVNGEIFPRPPPVYYSRRSNRDRRPREQNYGPPPQQNQGPTSQQNYGPRPQQNYGPPPQQNYGQRPQHSYGPPPPQNYGPPPSQNFGPPPPQNYGPPPSQNYGPPPSQNYGPPSSQNYGPPPSQNYGPPSSQNYGPPSSQNYGPPPSQTYGQPPSQTYGPTQQNIAPHPQQNYTPYSQQNFAPPKQGTASQPPQGYGSPPEQSFVPKTQQNYGNSPNFPPQENYNSAGPGERSGSMLPTEASGNGERTSISSYHGNFNQPELGNLYAQGQRNSEGHADKGSSQGGSFEQVSGAQRNFSSEWK